MTITVKVHVNGNFKSTVKHIAGGVDKEVRDVGPNEEVSFGFHSYVGDNIFVVSPDVPVDVDSIAEQEAQKEAVMGKEKAVAPPTPPPDKKASHAPAKK